MSMNDDNGNSMATPDGGDLRARRAALSPEKLRLLQRRLKGDSSGAALPRIAPRARPDATAVLSLPQQRLWFIEQLQGPSATYHVAGAYRLHGKLDRVAFRRTMDAIVARHEALRTRFVATGAGALQVIDPAMPFALDEVDLREIDRAGLDAAVNEHSRQVIDTPFDLVRGPLIRGRVLQVAADEFVLLLAMHHIVSDGWSMGVLVREVGALYSAFVTGAADPLPALPIQYADYAVWQREWLQGEVLQQQLDYWRGHLAGAPALLELPTDRPRPAVQSYRGASVEFELAPALTARLKQCAEAQGVTLFMLLYAGWSLLLSRLSGQSDVVVGVPVANRREAEVEGLIGFFVNSVALRLKVDEAQRVADLLKRVRELTLAGFAHQDLPFEQVVEALNPARSLGHSPLFQNLLVLQNTPSAAVELPGLRLSGQAVESSTSQFDVTLLLQENGDRLSGALNYASDLFDATTMQRWIGHLQVLLHALSGDPQQPVAALPWLDAAQRRTLLQDFAAPRAAYALEAGASLHARFAAQAARTPEAIAVEYEGETLTYAQLETRANQWAHRLRAAGVGPDRLVGLCVERSLELVVGVLAILKAGGAYVPLDPAYPSQRLAYLLEDAAPVLVLAQASCRSALPESAVPVIELDDAAVADQPGHAPVVPELTASHLAYVIYTSGSTGQPKGVMVEHAQVLRLFAATQADFGFGAGDTWTLFHSFAFDFSVWELWGALLHGGRLVVVPQLTTRSPAAFYRLLCERQVTVLNQTPTAFYQLIAAQAEASDPALSAHRLKWVVFGGEALSLRALQPWVARNGDRAPVLVNMYGITETTVHVTHKVLSAAEIAGEPASVVGRVLPDLGIYVLDARGEPVPVGVTGELYVGGAGVARGYLKRPQLTAERFLANRFGDAAMPRLYRTGDLGRWRADGTLDYLGRNDDQVKIRGFRIELGEIEAALRGVAGVADAAVLAREDVAGEKRLVAYVVAEADATLGLAELRAALAARLAEHLLPAAFVRLERLPLTGNGKLDRAALPAPDATSVARREYEAPVGEVEQALARIWQDLLGLDRVGRQDHFFELGGHSLMAVQVVARLQEMQGVQLPLRELFAQPTLAALAEVVCTTQIDGFAAADVHRLSDALDGLSEEELLAIWEAENA